MIKLIRTLLNWINRSGQWLGFLGLRMLFVLTLAAIAAVHWPAAWHTLRELGQGYAITDDGHGNFKLPVIFLAMLLPLILSGPGKLSLGAWIARRYLGKA